jgi:hypothetical protein
MYIARPSWPEFKGRCCVARPDQNGPAMYLTLLTERLVEYRKAARNGGAPIFFAFVF